MCRAVCSAEVGLNHCSFDRGHVHASGEQLTAALRAFTRTQLALVLEKGTSGTPRRRSNNVKLKSSQAYDQSDSKSGKKTNLDPTSVSLQRWNTVFMASCLVAISVDPLFYYLPYFDDRYNCIGISDGLKESATEFRIQFKTAYIAPSSRVFGRGDLVTDPKKIATRYLRKTFWVDLVAVLPIPQISISTQHTMHVERIGDRSRDSKNELLSSNTRDKEGAFMYMMAAEREQKCWAGVCANEALCQPKFLGCASLAIPGREAWLASTVGAEDFSVDNFNYGIFNVGMANNITATNFITRYFYSLWLCLLGLRTVMEVEAFPLSAGDLKFVANQFRKLHSIQLQQSFRYYSHHWRTWAPSFIQAAWRRYQRRKLAEIWRSEEEIFLLQEALRDEPEEENQ
uniref:Uncharacterized protein n=1 Tax=Physcomitrium patens TaxID=3218 RepID=A0A2K1IBD3_PHYPA|nr:hypothetical protein PHYPA_030047 [Physcomitrium patens]